MSKLRSRLSARILLLTLILLAFAVRMARLDAQSLWYDEGVTAWVAGMSPVDLTRWTANDIQPPLYYYLVALWGRLAGWSEWSLRFVSVFFGVLTVPLLTRLVWRLGWPVRSALLAALLGALHPLLLYYSQEARMYALLTALAVSLGTVVVGLGDRPTGRRLALYVGLAVAAVYTHYFAFFLLLALGIGYTLDQFMAVRTTYCARPWPALRRFAWANGLVLLAYLPWFWALVTRLTVDNSYWQGQLKLWDALGGVLTGFTTGETMREQQARWLLILYAVATGVALWRLAVDGPRGRRTLLYGGSWLLTPLVAVLLLASFVPKFNPRYVMLALPGLLLLWAAGLSGVAPARAGHRPAPGRAARWRALLPGLSLLLMLPGFLLADANWFRDPAFRKDQWREVAHDLRTNLQPEELVVLVSGHAWPVWTYYAPDLPVVRLPAIDVLDVDAVLDFSDTAAPLQRALEPLSERPGVWLIGWQDEVIDPMGIVPVQLEIAGREKGMDSRYWGLDLRRFSQLKTNWIPAQAPIDTPLDLLLAAPDNQNLAVLLRGYTLLDNGDLLLFWQLPPGQAETAADLYVRADTFPGDNLSAPNSDGDRIAQVSDRRLAGYTYPSFRWPADRVTMSHIPAADWLGVELQPGVYLVDLQVYAGGNTPPVPLLTAAGAQSVRLEPIAVTID